MLSVEKDQMVRNEEKVKLNGIELNESLQILCWYYHICFESVKKTQLLELLTKKIEVDSKS